jgi:hypothetical protein
MAKTSALMPLAPLGSLALNTKTQAMEASSSLSGTSAGTSDGGKEVVMGYSEARYNRFILFDTGDTL